VARVWTCRKCSTRNERKFSKCQGTVLAGGRQPKLIPCPGRKPKARPPAHRVALQKPYDWYVDRYGERCGICGFQRNVGDRRLDRDHDHKTGEPRGLLCHACNRRLWNGATVEWCLNAAKYLDAGL
jgi:hypothetical protein